VKTIFITVTNDLETDQRMHKTALTLSRNGFKVRLVGRRLKTSSTFTRSYAIKRFRFLINKGFGFYACYNLRLFFYLLFRKWDVVLACDMDTLPAGFLAARMRKKKVVFDSHELFSEVPELLERPFVKKVWRKLEDFLIPRLRYAYTVSRSIADYYESHYGTSFSVVRNVPAAKKASPLMPVNVTKRPFILYQGALNPHRGIEKIMAAMKFLPQLDLVIAGSGPLEDDLQTKRSAIDCKGNIHFTGHLDFDKLAGLTSRAWLGVSLEADKGMNYRFALPNKLFDYMHAGVPVLVSDLPEMRRFINDTGIGWSVSPDVSPENLSDTINELWNDTAAYQQMKKQTFLAAKKYTWEKESLKQLEIFRSV
jgi:glycosyltransferase involved in cell wall biosynthesis